LVEIKDAWIEGLQLSASARVDLSRTRSMLYLEIKKLVDYIEAKKTLDSDDIKEAVEFLFEDFKLYTIDEIIHIIRSMKKETGYFERLKYPEIKQRLDNHFNSESRADKIERHHAKFKEAENDEKMLDDVDYEAYKNREPETEQEIKTNQDYNNFKANYFSEKGKNKTK